MRRVSDDFSFEIQGAGEIGWRVKSLINKDWANDRCDYLFWSICFDEPVKSVILRIGARQGRLRGQVIATLQPGNREVHTYKTEEYGKHRFNKATTHEMHLVNTSSLTWDRMSFALVNRQFGYAANMKDRENTPQWLFDVDMSAIFEKYAPGRAKLLPFSPLDPEYYDPAVRSAADVPQKSPTWHILRKDTISSSAVSKLALGYCADKKYSGPVRSKACMRAGSFFEDAVALSILVHKPHLQYEERGWEPWPAHFPRLEEGLAFGDSVDGLFRDPTMHMGEVPIYVRRHWEKELRSLNAANPGVRGMTLNDIPIQLGVYEAKCSDVDLETSLRNAFLAQTAWHMMFTGRFWGLISRTQGFGVNAVTQVYMVWRDFTFEREILRLVKAAGMEVFKDPELLHEWKSRPDVKELASLWRRRAYGKTKGRLTDPGNFQVPWPGPEVFEYIEYTLVENGKLDRPVRGQGWLHELPLVPLKDPGRALKSYHPWENPKKLQPGRVYAPRDMSGGWITVKKRGQLTIDAQRAPDSSSEEVMLPSLPSSVSLLSPVVVGLVEDRPKAISIHSSTPPRQRKEKKRPSPEQARPKKSKKRRKRSASTERVMQKVISSFQTLVEEHDREEQNNDISLIASTTDCIRQLTAYLDATTSKCKPL